MKSLQNQYNLIKEGKGNKDVFIKSAKTQFPDIPNHYGFNETVNELKYRNILNEGMLGIVSAQPTVPDWFKLFNESVNEAKSDISIDKIKKQLDDLGVKYEMSKTDKVKPFKVIYKPINKSDKFYDKFDDIIDLANLKSVVKSSVNEAKAEEKKPTKEVVDMETRGFDYKDKKNIDNIYGEQFLKGFYTEMQDPKNEEKTVEELKSIVAKNLAKDQLHYVKDGQFGVKGVGYTTEHPGLGTPKEAKGKYKSSGYGNLNENQSLNKNTSPEFKVGDKITYLGHPGEITKVNKEMTGAITYNVAYDKGTGRIKATNIYNKGGEIKPLNESSKNKQYYKNIAYLDKTGLAKKQFSDEDIQTAKKMLSNGEFNLNEVSTLGLSGIKNFAKKHGFSVSSKSSGGRVPYITLTKDGKKYGPFDPTITTKDSLLKKLQLNESLNENTLAEIETPKRKPDLFRENQIRKAIRLIIKEELNKI